MTGVIQLVSAIDFAAKKHRDQRRKDAEKTPYINHPIGVMNILSEEGKVDDIPTLMAAVLHDTVEDCECTNDEIKELYGADVAGVVAEVTDDKNLPKEERKRMQVVNAPHKSKQAKLVKLADKLYNLRDLSRCNPEGWTEERVQQYREWGAKVCTGLLGTNAALEDALKAELGKYGVVLG